MREFEELMVKRLMASDARSGSSGGSELASLPLILKSDNRSTDDSTARRDDSYDMIAIDQG
jgi:hypothetical protein